MAGKFSLEAIFKGNDQLSKVIGSIESKTKGLGAGLNQINGINSKIAGGLANIAKQAAAVGLVVGGIAGAALFDIGKTGSDFEQAITNVGAVSLMTRDQIKDLESAALNLGATTKFTATESANAMETMARAGFNNAEVLAGIPGLLSAAAAEGITPQEVTEVVAATIKGMGMAANETGRVADVYALASARTKSSILSLGESMTVVGPVAAQLGVSFEDATAAVALLQDAGLDASVSGSAVATMLTKLATATPEVAAQMKAFGITFQDAKGNMLPFREVLANISKGSMKAGGNLQQMGFFSELAGMRGQKAALGLEKAFKSGKFAELGDSLVKDAKGVSEKMANIRIDTLQGDLTLLGSAVDSVKIALFGLEGGAMRKVVKRTNEWVTANQDLIVAKVQSFIEGISDALPKIVTWIERIGKILFVLGAFALGIKAMAGAMWLWNAAAAANPWVLLIYAIVILTALVVAFWPEIAKHEKTFRQVGVALAFLAGTVAFAASVYGIFLLVTNAQTIATIAYIGWVLAARAAVAAWAFITNWQAIKTGIATAAIVLKTTVLGGYNAALGFARAGIVLFTGQTVTMTGAMTAALGPALALAAAVGALYLAYKANADLKANTEGLGIFDIAGGMIKEGTLDPFAVVDKHQNKLARDRAKLPPTSSTPGAPAIPGMPALPGMPPGQDPQAMIAALMAQQGAIPGATSANGKAPAQSAKETGESLAAAMGPVLTEALKKGKGEVTITVKGGSGTIDKQPASGFELNMSPSGAF